MLLQLERVAKSFGGLVAIQDLDLALNEGEILGLIGPNPNAGGSAELIPPRWTIRFSLPAG